MKPIFISDKLAESIFSSMPPKTQTKEISAARQDTRSSLSREQLVAESLRILQDDGLAGLSTRRLAERLQVKSPALYWHVRNKEELLQLVADAICSQIVLPQPDLPFRRQLETIAQEYRRVLTMYRDASRLFVEQPPIGPQRIQLYDVAVGVFRKAGFDLAESVAMATFFRHYLLGMIHEEVRQQQVTAAHTSSPASALGIELQHQAISGLHFPNLVGTADVLQQMRPEHLFTMGLRVLLDGIECRLQTIRNV